MEGLAAAHVVIRVALQPVADNDQWQQQQEQQHELGVE
jgi:hypothetical protein